MYAIHHPIKFLLVYKDLFGLVIQLGLLLATAALIRVGSRQAKAAKAQATAANQQVIAALQQVTAANAQAKAAEAQVAVALQQVELTKAQVKTAALQFQASVTHGAASMRPIFKFRIAERGFVSTPVIIKNVGFGAAFNTTWKFVRPPNAACEDHVYPIGTLSVDQEEVMPWPFDMENPRLQARMVDEKYGINVECIDAIGNSYTTIVTKDDQDSFMTDSDAG
jgi:hypothetical protein